MAVLAGSSALAQHGLLQQPDPLLSSTGPLPLSTLRPGSAGTDGEEGGGPEEDEEGRAAAAAERGEGGKAMSR